MLPKPYCSKLDRIFACNGSILETKSPREAGGPEANLGRARHEALSYVPQGVDPPLESIASRYGVTIDELSVALAMGRQAWDEVGLYFPDAAVERRLSSKVCVGTADVIYATRNAVRVADWKTGHGTDAHPYQLKGYAHCAVEEFGVPANGVVSVFEIWTSHREIRTTNIEISELTAFAGQLAQIVEVAEQNPGRLEYRAGSHCKFCDHRPTCPSHALWIRGATTALLSTGGGAVTREALGGLYEKAVEVDRAMRRFWAVFDLALEAGPIELPDGRRVERVSVEREKISAAVALSVLRDEDLLTGKAEDDLLLGDLAKSALDRWAGSVTVRGRKAALLRRVFGALREAGAIRTEARKVRKVLGGN